MNNKSEFKKQWDKYPTKVVDGREVKDIPARDIASLRQKLDCGCELEVKSSPVMPSNRVSTLPHQKTLSEKLLNHERWQDRVGAKFGDIELEGAAIELIEGKATMTTTAGFAPQVVRDTVVVPKISRPVQLLDLIRVEPTDQNSVKFMKQTVRTNAAAPKGEGASFDEATIEYSEATVDVRKIGVYLPVTEEQLEDEPGVKSLIENDLALMVRQKFDEQVTIGDGTGSNLEGLISAPGALTQALGTDEPFDALMKAMTQVRTIGRAKPNLIVLNSADLQTLALTKTADGQYIFGSPADAPMSRLWGTQIAISDALPVGTALVLDTDYIRLKMRKDLTVASSDSHSDYFVENKQAIRAYVRAGLQVLRDEAICIVTGLENA